MKEITCKLRPVVEVENVTIETVTAIAQITKARIYQLMDRGLFPDRHKLPSGGVRWNRAAVEAWARGKWQPCAKVAA